MKSVIGVDFDNTIADYDLVFSRVANQMGLLEKGVVMSKADVKKYLLSQENGDLSWQRLQGQIYGKYMNIAEIFPGFMEFLILAKIKKNPVYIVSHKSEFGHFDENKISLREEAMKWIISKKIEGAENNKLEKENIFFEPTRVDKINRIAQLGCTNFVDDLPEVFNETIFPKRVKKYLFDPFGKSEHDPAFENVRSWRSLTSVLLGEWENENIAEATQIVFPGFEVRDVELRKGRGNSRIYKLSVAVSEQCALKVYPDRQHDKRQRLITEFTALSILGNAGFSVPKALAKDADVNWAVYSWIDGVIPQSDESFVIESIGFIKDLKRLSQFSEQFENFSEASEACLNGTEIEKQINDRLALLKSVSSEELLQFLNVAFTPLLQDSLLTAKSQVGDYFDIPLEHSLQIPSPSDFGSHNAIKDKSGKTVFIDFEYFGWDDPVKLIADFYWHPAMDLSDKLKEFWLFNTKDIFETDKLFQIRLSSYLPLFGLRWCLILLNEFLPHRMEQRIHADKSKIADIQKIQIEQLDKSKKLLERIIKITKNHGSTFQTP
jgi:hypothetical protein